MICAVDTDVNVCNCFLSEQDMILVVDNTFMTPYFQVRTCQPGAVVSAMSETRTTLIHKSIIVSSPSV